jgi:DNA-directed RNA polymerase specialized sigma24 family protein
MPPFEQIVTEHGAVVLRVCRAMLPPADADDAWSETFLAALRAYPDLPPGSNVRAWLATIAHRKAIDRHRAAARAPVPAGALPDRPSPHPHRAGHRPVGGRPRAAAQAARRGRLPLPG